MIEVLAPAKINLGLEILGKRSDGFHEIRTVFCTFSLFDRVGVTAAPNSGFRWDGPEIVGENLAESAIRLARASFQDLPAARVSIEKRIPMAAGLGGASSDAAASLRGLNRIARQPLTERELLRVALDCGSDVPFLLDGGLAIGRGRGELLEPLPYRALYAIVIVPTTTIPDKTRSMYGHIRASDWADESRIEAAAERLRDGHDLQDSDLANAFERPLFNLLPAMRMIAARAESILARPVHISGAGPAMYTLAPDLASALRDAGLLRKSIHPARARVYCVRSTSKILIQESRDD